jgi:exodeoxyribonuclease V beta subunit
MTPLDPVKVELTGRAVIEASAGTGKTYTITTLFTRLLLERELEVSQILVVTYTRAATAELRDRIRRRLGEMLQAVAAHCAGEGVDDQNLRRLCEARGAAGTLDEDRKRLAWAIRDFDQAAIFTIHGFCQRTLGETALESRVPFDLELLQDESALLREVALDYWASRAYSASPRLVRAMRGGGAGPDELTVLAGKVARAPEMPVVPAQSELAPTAEPLDDAAFVRAREEAQRLWRANRDGILALLTDGRLNGNTHRPATITGRWAPVLDHLDHLEAEDAPDWLVKLTPPELVRRTKKKQTPPEHPFFDAVERLLRASQALKAALADHVLHVRRQACDYVRAELAARKQRLGVQSFDDLLHGLWAALEGRGGGRLLSVIRTRYRAALIDEFQDTDPVQYRIFGRIFEAPGHTLFQIGDPKQAIYAFRGADVFAYMEAAEDAGDRVYTLGTSYRSDPSLLRAINLLFTRARRPFVFGAIRYEPVTPRPGASDRLSNGGRDAAALQLLFVPRTDDNTSSRKTIAVSGWAERRLPEHVADEIVGLLASDTRLEGEPIEPRHVAVLCRSNAQARITQRALMERGVPTVLEGHNSVFDTDGARELERVMAAMAQPADARRVQAALATAIVGVDGESLYAMREGGSELDAWVERFIDWGRLWHERGFMDAFYHLMDEAQVARRLLRRSDGQRLLTDVLHLSELAHEASLTQHLGPQSLLRWLARMRQDGSVRGELADDATQVRLEHDEHAVRLTTIHRSKGLEYPIVFCPFLWGRSRVGGGDVSFHDPKDERRLKLDIGSRDRDEHAQLALREALAEDLRLLYVAVTRAKHRCYVLWGRFGGKGELAGPLPHLLHQGDVPDGALEWGVSERLAKMSDAELRAELAQLCEASGGAVGLRDLHLGPPREYRGSARPAEQLAARVRSRRLPAWLRSASFSRLIAQRGDSTAEGVSAPAAEGLDHDELPAPGPEVRASRVGESRVTLADFPAGPRPGTLIHGIFEHIDFGRRDPDELGRVSDEWLQRYGLDAGALSPSLQQGIAQVLATPLPAPCGESFSLGEVEPHARLDELEFLLPVAQGGVPLGPGALAQVFRRHAAPAVAPDYHARLAELGFTRVAGYLKGFVDLVFRHQGRFYVVDYKSNWLGNHPGDYVPERLRSAMLEHDYVLQYHLYTVALHRYLSRRLPDYDYGRCFGGVFYLFVRGMAPQHAPGTGIHTDRPAEALIRDLSALLEHGEAAA